MELGMMLSFAFGVVVGWVWRSWQFGYDEDCCNPDHKKRTDAST